MFKDIRLVTSKTDNGFIRIGMYDEDAADPLDGYFILLPPDQVLRHIEALLRLLNEPLAPNPSRG